MRRLIAIASVAVFALLPSIATQSDPRHPSPTISGRNNGSSSEVTGEISQEIPSSESNSGEPPSQEHPTVTASDPSMWEDQPHRDCSPKPGKGLQEAMGCEFGRKATRPQDNTPDTGNSSEPRTVTITNRQAATLIAQGSGITRQPPGPKVVISKAFIVYTNPTARHQTTTILGTQVDVEFTPTSYTWNWGDGTTTTTTDPGAPYPHQTVTHHYQHTATAVTTTLTTTWTTRYRPQGDSQWRPIEGTITTTETSTPYDLVRITSYLTDDAEEAQGH